MALPPSPFLSAPPFPADGYARLADRLKRLLGSSGDLVFVQGEAIIALEAVATSIARPGVTALNVVTSPYGAWFGTWLRRGGALVTEVVAEPGKPIALEAVSAALTKAGQVDIVALVHAEAANGSLNPLAEIAAHARRHGAVVVVDAVASVGAHSLAVDAEGLDIVVIGPQKALSGPAGISAVTLSPAAWQLVTAPGGIVQSTLSLLDLRHNWLERGRGVLPGMPSALEFWALDAALDRVEAEGVEHLVARHRRAAQATRAGLRALGIAPWIERDESAAGVVTAAVVPRGVDADLLIAAAARLGVGIGRGFGDIASSLVRLDHTGARAAFTFVLSNVAAYGAALNFLGHPVEIGAGLEAVTEAYAAPSAFPS